MGTKLDWEVDVEEGTVDMMGHGEGGGIVRGDSSGWTSDAKG